MRRNRLTERDLSRIVKRVVKEQDFVENDYCDIDVEELSDFYNDFQPLVDKLIESENISYDCDSHKYFVRKKLIGELCRKWSQGLKSPLPKDYNPMEFYDFLKSRYGI